MKYLKYLLILILGFVLGYFVLKKTIKNNTTEEASSFIAYGLQRLNKMVVAEQTYAGFYSHKSTTSYAANLFSFEKNLLLEVKIKAQASYDLSKLKVRIDSTNQTIYIEKIPPLKIETFPDVNFFDVQQSVLNQFTKKDLNGIKQRAIAEVSKTIDKTDLKKEAQEQLIDNLSEIYLLAKIYHWKVVDDTPYAEVLKSKIKV